MKPIKHFHPHLNLIKTTHNFLFFYSLYDHLSQNSIQCTLTLSLSLALSLSLSLYIYIYIYIYIYMCVCVWDR
jgi:hypothetical protein